MPLFDARLARAVGGFGVGLVAGLVQRPFLECAEQAEQSYADLEQKVAELERDNKRLAQRIELSEYSLQEKEYLLKTAKKTVAVFGGSFDPITNAHLNCACEIVHLRVADEVWLVPCGPRPDKPSLVTPANERLIMCHLAVNTSFGSTFPVRVCDLETKEPKALPTLELMKRLEAKYPQYNFTFVIGSDLIPDMRSWKADNIPDHGHRLWQECSFLGLPRPGYMSNMQELPIKFRWLTDSTRVSNANLVTSELSSSEVRNRIQSFGEFERENIVQRNLQSIEGLMPASVVAHILRNNLYMPSGFKSGFFNE